MSVRSKRFISTVPVNVSDDSGSGETGSNDSNDAKEQLSLQIGNNEWCEMVFDKTDLSKSIHPHIADKLSDNEKRLLSMQKKQYGRCSLEDDSNELREEYNEQLAGRREAEHLTGIDAVRKHHTDVHAYRRVVKMSLVSSVHTTGCRRLYLKYGSDENQKIRDRLLSRLNKAGSKTIEDITGVGAGDKAIQNVYDNGVMTDDYVDDTLSFYL